MDMQIEMEKLRKELMVLQFDYEAEVYGTISYAESMQKLSMSLSYEFFRDEWEWRRGDDTTLLGRARDRIMRGEKWDVREAFVPFPIFDKFEPVVVGKDSSGREVTLSDNGNVVYLDTGEMVKGRFIFPSDEFSHEPKIEGGQWVVIDDDSIVNAEQIPTLRELLERDNAIIIMDAKSAADAVKRIEGKIEAVGKLRDQYTQAVGSYQQSKDSGEAFDTRGISATAMAVFKKIAFGNNTPLFNMMAPSSLFIDPVAPGFFYFGGYEELGIPDRIVAGSNVGRSVSQEDFAKGLGTFSPNLPKPVDVNKWPDTNMRTETPRQSPPIGNKV
jgi:hypothetical protein